MSYIVRKLLIGASILLLCGCSLKWTEAIRQGKIAQTAFSETIPMESINGLVFIPVTIGGEEYRFLFDTGAPTSISKHVQQKFAFNIISQGNIIDSDHNRKMVQWVQIDSLSIGNVSFLQQTAFIGDFELNPILDCLDIDGIIGSNLIRQCNWTLDQERNLLMLFKNMESKRDVQSLTLPFKSDFQYNIFVDIPLGEFTLQNVLVDFGSNGSLSLSNSIFSFLNKHKLIDTSYTEIGIQVSGIIGEPVPMNRKFTLTDSVHIGNLFIKNTMLQTGKTVSMGNNFLSRFQLTIDWDTKNLYFSGIPETGPPYEHVGFKLGYTKQKGIYIQSVIENSNAYELGIRPNMTVLKLDHLDFDKGSDFCDYIFHSSNDSIYMRLRDEQGKLLDYSIEKTHY